MADRPTKGAQARVEDLYPLTPVQHGLVYHSLLDPEKGLYAEQFTYTLEGRLDAAAFRAAWADVVARHAAFRTGFVTEDVKEPLQVVRSSVELPWRDEDWSTLDAAEIEARFERLCSEHRLEPFEIKRAPLSRFALVRVDDETHRFAWTFHHAILDGWSVAIVLREVQQLYEHHRTGAPTGLSAPRPYRDYIAWLKGQDGRKAEEYWRERVSDLVAPTPLGLDLVRSPDSTEASSGSAIIGHQLTAELTDGLEALARERGLTLTSVLQATWAILLARYSGTADVTFGTVTAGRPTELPGADGMVGLFINVLPARTAVDAERSVAELMSAVQAEQVTQRDVAYASLVDIQGWSGVPRTVPLFESAFVFENFPRGSSAEDESGLVVRRDAAQTTSNYPVTIIVAPGERLTIEASFDRARFEEEAVRRILGHFDVALTAIVADPELRVADVGLLTEAERDEQKAWNDTAVVYPEVETLHQVIEARAKAAPDAVAVSYRGESISYGELNGRANQLARYLRSEGVGAESRVAVAMDRSIELMVALLGVLKAGGAYLPIDPDYPADRIAFCLEDGSPAVALVQDAYRGLIGTAPATILALDTEWDTVASFSPADLGVGHADHAAYVIYTSGSTGRPKGVVNTHRGICNRLQWMQSAYDAGPGDRVLQKTPSSFDVSVWEFFWPLMYGAQIVMAEPGGHRDPEYLYRTILERDVTMLHFVPSMLQAFESALGDSKESGSLKRIVCSGEALSPEVRDRTLRRFVDIELHNLYGPTEAAVDVTATPCAVGEPVHTVPIGRPVSNTQIHLLDPVGSRVPAGVGAELFIGGVQVAREYLRRPALTAERFVPDAFAIEPGSRMYRTGDLARYVDDGMVEFLGRVDHQVKVRGVRIELGEIEATLDGHPEVAQSVVVARPLPSGDTGLVAYVATDFDGPELGDVLKAHVAARLPDAMVPAFIVPLVELPLTPNGKVDRKALPDPDVSGAAADRPYVGPRTPWEEVLAGLWQDILGVEQVPVDVSFFDIGGHSLLATQLIGRIGKAFDVKLPLRALFDHDTIESLARAVERAKSEGSVAPDQIPLLEDGEPKPLSFAQERLFVLDELDPGQPTYNVVAALDVEGDLDVDALVAAFDRALALHDALRTTIARSEDGRLEQRVAESVPGLGVVDLNHEHPDAAPSDIGTRAQEWVTREAATPFDLGEGPLVRGSVLRLSADRHIVVLNTHHIVTDGWSMSLFIRDVSEAYAELIAGEVPTREPPAFQYADYAAWHRSWLEAGALEQQLDFWRRQLDGAPGQLELPTDRPRPPRRRGRGRTLDVALEPSLTARLGEVGRAEGATLFMVVLAAFQALLARYSGQDDIVVGSPIAGRSRAEVEDTVGLFVNTLALRTDVSGSPTFRELLTRVRETTLNAYAHQELPFERLVDALEVERDLSRTPVFQAMFVLQNDPITPDALPGVTLRRFDIERPVSKFDLTLDLAETDAGLSGTLEYDSDLFDEETIERFAAHLAGLLTAIATDPSAVVDRVSLLTEGERLAHARFNETEHEVDFASLAARFEAQVDAHPDSVALIAGEVQVTWRELDHHANRLAHTLRGRGVGRESIVGVLLERSPEMVASLLAIAKAGAAYLPLETTYPRERLAFILRDADPTAVLVGADLDGLLPPDFPAERLLQSDALDLASQPTARLASYPGEQGLAYVIYTSGSTGRPKGTLLTHGGLSNYLAWAGDAYDVRDAGPTVLHSPLGFDLTITSLWVPLLAGQSVSILEPELPLDVLGAELVSRADQSLLKLTPAHLSFLRYQIPSDRAADVARVLVVGGEQLTGSDVAWWREHAPETRIVNEYGPTETVVGCCVHVVDGGAAYRGAVPIGRPIWNTRLDLVDREAEPVPSGVSGELLIGGAGVARGYLGRAGLTAERFVPDPAEKGGRRYRTGDLVRLRGEIGLEFLGRIDHQVKIRGHRIELGEIEAALDGHPEVTRSVVEARPGPGGHARLVAWVGSARSDSSFADELRDALGEHLPEAMVPAVLVSLPELPLTPNGKVDRAALPDPARVSASDDEPLVPLQSDSERLVGRVWAEVLGGEVPSANTHFFRSGGQSLLATQVVARLRDELDTDVPLRLLFEHPTVASFAKALDEQAGATETSIEPRPLDEAPPLSFAQERLWFIDRMEAGSATYNVPAALRLRGPLDVDALERAFDAVAARHESLRTVFPEVDGRAVARVSESGSWSLCREDLTAEPPAQRERVVQALVHEEAAAPFDLATGPLARAALFQLAPDDAVLVVTLHHIVSDGWSLGVLIGDLTAAYEAFTAGRQPDWSPLDVQYGDYAAWQREWADTGGLEKQLDYWRTKLAGVSVLEIPTDRPRPPVQTFQGRTIEVALDDAANQAVRTLAADHGATPFMVLMAGFQALLARYSGQPDVVVGTPVAGRHRTETEPLIGFFVNTLAMRGDFSKNPTGREHLEATKGAVLEALANQDAPLERIIDELGVERDLSRTPLFQVALALQNAPVPEVEVAGLHMEPRRADAAVSKFDLTVNLGENARGISGGLEFSTDLFDETTVRRMWGHLNRLLVALADEPDRRVSEIELLSTEERALRLGRWSPQPSAYPRDRTLVDLFEGHAHADPDRIAVRSGTESLTHGALDRASNRLARQLRASGVGSESRVGVCLSRSTDFVISALAAVKCGAAYVPLDPSYPDDRLDFMVEDAQVEVVVTNAVLASRVPERCDRIVHLEGDAQAILGRSAAPLQLPITPDQLAYVTYTSGSTGRPKGIGVPHRGVVRLVCGTDFVSLGPDDVLSHQSNTSFDATTLELWGALLHGGSLAVIPGEVLLDPTQYVEALRRHGATAFFITSALFNRVVSARPDGFATVDTLLVGGEALDPTSIRAALDAGPPRRLMNGYGPTENTTFSTTHLIEAVTPDARSVPIGTPIANSSGYVIDRAQHLVPVGVEGELVVGGDGLARGYVDRPSLTAERFVPHPFATEPGARVYRTGDVVAHDARGRILFRGRRDHQVKVRGFRIELGEIEAALSGLEAVSDVVVVVRADRGTRQLVAYVVGASDEIDVADLRARLLEQLPDYMVPTSYVVLEALPLNDNGKVDRAALPAPDAGRPDTGTFVAPRTEAEQVLTDVWSEVLGVDGVGVQDNFFLLGGDSILSIQIVSRAARAGLSISPRDVFQHQTIEELALVAVPVGESSAGLLPTTGAIPLTPIQRWFLDGDFGEEHHFNQAVLLEATEAVDVTALAKASEEIVAHHDALRARFTRGEEGWAQEVVPDIVAPVFSSAAIDATGDLSAELNAEFAAVQASFRLDEGLLFKVRHLSLPDGSERVLAVAHHLVVDGVSWRVLLDDLLAAYQRIRSGGDGALPPKTVSFRGWAEDLVERADDVSDDEVAWWTDVDEAVQNGTPLPRDLGGENTVGAASAVTELLSEEETEVLLKEVARAYGASAEDALLAAFSTALCAWSLREEVVVDLEGHGREDLGAGLDVSRTVGWFTAMYPIRLPASGSNDVRGALIAAKEAVWTVPRKGMGYGLLALGADGRRRQPSPEVSFNYLGRFDGALSSEAPFRFAPEDAGPTQDASARRAHLLDCSGIVHDGRLRVTLRYGTEVHSRETAESILRDMLAALRATLEHCAATEGAYTPSDFPLAQLNQAEVERLTGRGRVLADLYPASPMQAGLLFHSEMASDSGVYVSQIVLRLDGELDVVRFQEAWQSVIDAVPILRTSFLLGDVARPLQRVHRSAEADWVVSSDVLGAEAEVEIDRLLDEDRRHGFTADRAPLMRFYLVREDSARWHFAWSHHHALLDGWSVPLVLEQVFGTYESGGVPPAVTPPFRNYIEWLEGRDPDAAERFWRAELGDFDTPTRVQLVGPAEPGADPELAFTLSESETARLEELARGQRVTLNTVVQAAWALTLNGVAGVDDVVFGATVAGRPTELAGSDSMIGLFINTVPVRVRMRPTDVVGPWLQALQDRQLEARRFEDTPLLDAQRWSGIEAGAGLFETIVVYENYPMSESLADTDRELRVSQARGEEQNHIPLSLYASPGDVLTLKLAFDTNRFSRAGVETLMGRMVAVLGELAVGPDRILAELDPRAPSERTGEGSAMAGDAQPIEPYRIEQAFEATAAKDPDRVAVVGGDSIVTYAELERRANQVARFLRTRGVGFEDRVGVFQTRDASLMATLLGVMKAGAAYVPLDPAYPPQRIAAILEDSEADLVVADREMVAGLPDFEGSVLVLEDVAEDVAAQSTAPIGHIGSAIGIEGLAYVAFTSGSTGRPKGVPATHRSVANFLDGMIHEPGFDAEDVHACVTTISFDPSVLELFVPLCTGAKLVMGTPAEARDPALLSAFFDAHRANLGQATPNTWRMLSEDGWTAPSFLNVMTGGQALPRDLAAELIESAHRLYNVYGPTETTVWSTLADVRDADAISVGRPIQNQRVFLMDRWLRPVPDGVPGELWIGGEGVSRGYLRRPGHTAERFVPSPDPTAYGTRVYRTGDEIRLLDSTLHFVGRLDHQVKIRGFRVELGEIEDALLSLEGVTDAVVVARANEHGVDALVGYVASPDSLDPASLQSALTERLPDYMVPTLWAVLEALPLSPNGKVDRKALPAVESSSGRDSSPLRTPMEHRVAGAFAEVLGEDSVGALDDFFRMGGHSLLATRLVSGLRRELGVELPVRALFEHPTVRALAAELDRIEGRPSELGGAVVPIHRSQRLPLSFAQERLWFLDRLDPNSGAYNMPAALRISGPLDVSALEAAIREVVRRHEPLRTTFAEDAEGPHQEVGPSASVSLHVADLRAVPDAARSALVHALAAEESARPFDLNEGPLLRALLIQEGDGDFVAVLTSHHVVSDGWSVGVLVNELSALFERFAAGQPSALSELEVQYADYAAWQRSPDVVAALDGQLDYWREQLAGVVPLDLPYDRSRPPVQTFNGASVPLVLDAALSQRVREVSEAIGATPFMTLMAALQLLMQRYSGQDDIAIGTPIAGRTRSEVEPLIGFFANTLVLRAELSEDRSFSQLLGVVRETALDAYANQDVPFERLVTELVTTRDQSRPPLFDVLFVLQNAERGDLDLGDVRLSEFEHEGETAKFDLTFSLVEVEDDFRGSIEFNTDLFDRRSIEGMASTFRALLGAVLDRPRARLSTLPLLDRADRRRQLIDYNDTAVDFGQPETVHAQFAERARETPDAIAVEYEGSSLTFAALERGANRVARALRDTGVTVDDRVGVATDRSVEMAVAVLGALKAGAAYVPLDTHYPPERRSWMLEDASVRTVLTTSRAAPGDEALADVDAPIILVDRVASDGGCSSAPLVDQSTEGSAAFVIYTSGSTGRPKGVTMPHGGLTNLVAWSRERGPKSGAVRLGQFASISFDVSFQDLFVAWARNGPVVILPEEIRRDPEAILDFLERHRIERFDVPFVALQQMAEVAQDRATLPDSLVDLITAGEQLHITPAIADLMRRLPKAALDNQYGPTEAHVVTAQMHEGEPTQWRPLAPIGPPVPNTRAYLTDRDGRLVPSGAIGDLHFSGPQVARGYLARPGLTAERFVPDPFDEAGARLYQTGDRARYLDGGVLQFLGRADHQLKIRGFRVELGEIEVALGALPQVAEAVVVARSDRAGNDRIVGYALPRDGERLAWEEIERAMACSMPEYMVPSAWVEVESWPLTPSGKVDRKALPEPDLSRASSASEALTPYERIIEGIWEDLLGVEGVSTTADFFQIGGHSLLATRVMSKILGVFDVELPLRTLFEEPTISGLARRVEAAEKTDRAASVAPIESTGASAGAVSFAQERLWFLDQLQPGNAAYNVPTVVRMRGDLSVDALSAAIAEIARRHEVLRTGFDEVDGQPRSRVDTVRTGDLLRVVDLQGVADTASASDLEPWISDEIRRPFDLSAGRPMRVSVFRLGPTDHVVAFTMHHIVSDGWSAGLLVRELGALYAELTEGSPSSLPDLEIQYADFARWQRGWLTGDVLERQMDFWKRHLADAPEALELPTDHRRPVVQSMRGAAVDVEVAGVQADRVRGLSRQLGVTPFMTLLAAFQVLLHKLSGQREIVVGSPIAGRNRPEVEPLVGFFVNTLPLCTTVDRTATFRDLLASVRESSLGAYANQDIPFERIVEAIEPQRDRSRSPLFQAMFVLQNNEAAATSMGGLDVRPLGGESDTTKFDLTLSLRPNEDRYVGVLEYCTDLFEAESVARWTEYFEAILGSVLADLDTPISEIRLGSPDDLMREAAEWNKTNDAVVAADVLERFEGAAASAPDRVALTSPSGSLTFGDLDRRASAVAQVLRERGVGPEDVVGLWLDRSPEMVVSLLGVLKAGGAYLPLDTTLPTERIRFMWADAEPTAVLTSRTVSVEWPVDGSAPLNVDDVWEGRPLPRALSKRSPDQLAYVIYTSGSTGLPKGTLVPHGGLSNYLEWAAERYRISDGSGSVVHSPLTFDLTVTSLLVPVVHGQAVHLLAPDATPAALGGQVATAWDATLLKLTPSHLALLGEQIPSEAKAGRSRVMVVGGEELTSEVARPWLDLEPSTEIVNEYGPTETVVGCCVHSVTQADLDASSMPIGTPIRNTQLHVRSDDGVLLPAGVRGELHIGGAGVTRGYLRRPGLTGDRFVPNPLGDGDRLYRSGDLVRRRSDGVLLYLGRADEQVKVRGYRIELGEIEVALEQDPAVARACVVALDGPSGRALHAYAAGEGLERDALLARLESQLPAYMVPASLTILADIPLTPNGKVDRRALPALSVAEGGDQEGASTDVERALLEIWREVLAHDSFGVTDDFFRVGGHSLLATRVVSRIRDTLGHDLPLSVMFEHTTVRGLARALESAEVGTEGPRLESRGLVGAHPLSFAQQRLWLIDRMRPGDASYNMYAALRIRGAVSTAALDQTLTEICRRHAVLRATFVERDGSPVQVIGEEAGMLARTIDLTAAPEMLEDVMRAEAGRGFDLAAGPLLRFLLVRYAPDEHILIFTTHHIVSDGWSLGLMVREFSDLYRSSVTGSASELEELEVQYPDFAIWQREWADSGGLEEQMRYWRERLAGDPPRLALPSDRPRPEVETGHGGSVVVSLPAELSAAVRRVSQDEGVTLFMTLLSVFKAQLQRYTGHDDVIVGTDMAGRSRSDAEKMIGFFINLLVLRTDLGGSPTFRELLQRVRETAVGAFRNQDVPFDMLVQELRPDRQLTDTPLFQVLFVLQNTPTGDLSMPDSELELLPMEATTSKFDLALFVTEGRDEISILWQYKTDLFEAPTIERLAGHFRRLLEQAVADPDRPIGELKLTVERSRKGRRSRGAAKALDLDVLDGGGDD